MRDDDLAQRPALRALRRRAYEELNVAVDQSGGRLPPDWLGAGDRDLDSLRRLREPEWLLLVRRQTGKPQPGDKQLPGSAWGDPYRRRNEWRAVAVVLVLLAALVAAACIPDWTWIALGAVAVGSGLTLVFALTRHRWLILAGIVLVGGAVYLLFQAPVWVPAVLGLLLVAGGAVYRSMLAAAAGEAADKASIAVWRERLARELDAAAEAKKDLDRTDRDPPRRH